MTRQKHPKRKDPSYKSLKADYYPVQRTVQPASTADAAPIKVCDIGKLLSQVNHRLYRQGKTYQVKVDLATQEIDTGTYEVYALVDTWYIQKAWQLARATYEEAMADERAQMGEDMAARWEDFRVNSGVTGGYNTHAWRWNNDGTGALDSAGEFLESRVTLPDGSTQRSFTWGVTGSNTLGMLTEYDKVNNTQANQVTTDLAYSEIGADVQELAADDLKDRGRDPPYSALTFNSRVWVRIAVLNNSLNSAGQSNQTNKLSTGFFNAPCGLVLVKTPTPNTALNGQLSITTKAGKYKGVAAMNMGV